MEMSKPDEIWRKFEASGKISDYIEYSNCNRGFSAGEGDLADDNCNWTGGFGTSSW